MKSFGIAVSHILRRCEYTANFARFFFGITLPNANIISIHVCIVYHSIQKMIVYIIINNNKRFHKKCNYITVHTTFHNGTIPTN